MPTEHSDAGLMFSPRSAGDGRIMFDTAGVGVGGVDRLTAFYSRAVHQRNIDCRLIVAQRHDMTAQNYVTLKNILCQQCPNADWGGAEGVIVDGVAEANPTSPLQSDEELSSNRVARVLPNTIYSALIIFHFNVGSDAAYSWGSFIGEYFMTGGPLLATFVITVFVQLGMALYLHDAVVNVEGDLSDTCDGPDFKLQVYTTKTSSSAMNSAHL